MRVLMVARDTLYSSPGGDTTQIEMTAKYLRKLGIEVDVNTGSSKTRYAEYDLMHFFNIIRPDDILPHIAGSKLPYVVSTILVDYLDYEKSTRNGVAGAATRLLGRDHLEYVKAIARAVKNGSRLKSSYYLLNGHRRSVKKVVRGASILLPNSHSEYRRLKDIYAIERPYVKVANAIDEELFNEDVCPDVNYACHILCVGRIEGRKNQLNLIKAMTGTGLKLSIIGKASPNHAEYYNECVREASKDKNIRIISHLNHKDLAAVYRAAKVHVLPSWFETTGLSSLEAGAMGCNIVVTRKGDTEEYFSDMAHYCDPQDVNSIREAVMKAHREPVNQNLRRYIMDHYTWNLAARQTLEAYQLALN